MAGSGRGAWIPHAVLLAGLGLVLLPIYVAFVASSLSLRDILAAPMTLIPGRQLIANYREALTSGTMATSGQSVAAMMVNSLVMALLIAVGKIAISLPSAYAVVFFRFPLRRLCFWAIFVTLMLPWRCGSSRPIRSRPICVSSTPMPVLLCH
jgi:sn-glycerol 3-phosphate transport system permease protein